MSPQPGRSARSNTSLPGSRPRRRPAGALLPRIPLPITTHSGVCAAAVSTRIGQPGSPIGVIPPYSMPVWATASSIAAGDLAHVQVLAHRLVHVGAIRGQHQAGRHGGDITAPTGNHHAVDGDLQRHRVRSAEGRRIGEVRVDRGDQALQVQGMTIAVTTDGASSSGRSATGSHSSVPAILTAASLPRHQHRALPNPGW